MMGISGEKERMVMTIFSDFESVMKILIRECKKYMLGVFGDVWK